MGILRVKEILKEKGIKGKELAVKVGISETAMSNIVKGQSLPRQEVLLKIADTLNVDIRQLFNTTKGNSLLNGFVEYQNEVYRISTKKDLENLLDVITN
ncbi:helix-turn-helix domain-containing protein [Kordia sp.]|uniref:helix-turn-helix domain-containing protein n=1 Tax=Kordia sp. TaxID=1965332 RepID=UPI003D2960EE